MKIKKSLRRTLVLSQSGISDFLLPSKYCLSNNRGGRTYFASFSVRLKGRRPPAPHKSTPMLPATTKISKSYCMFVTLIKCFRQCCSQNKLKSQNCKLAAFQENSSQLSKRYSFISQYWQNGNTEARVKLLSFNCIILKTARPGKFKFGENAF